MDWFIVVDSLKRWKLNLEGADIVAARDYLSNPTFLDKKKVVILNLCRSYAYQSIGYYVSLLAEARGHRVIPSVETIQDFKVPTIFRTLSEEISPTIQKALSPVKADTFTLSVYFGRNLARRYDVLCRQLSALFPAPMVRAQFRKYDDKWELENISPLASKDVPDSHREFFEEAARDYILSRPTLTRRNRKVKFDLAMLVNPEDKTAPSNELALRKFEKAGERIGVRVVRIEPDDYQELAEYDGLFIRTTTAVQHFTYRFARRAQMEGMAVIDDPLSILRCTNKVYLEEILSRKQIPTPRTMIVHKDNLAQVIPTIGLPCILKQPDSSFSQGVIKISTQEDFEVRTHELLEESELLIAQEFVPTDFDWRIGIIDRKPFYACRYYMAEGHWQIYNHSAAEADDRVGNVDAVRIDEVPKSVISAAIRASEAIGDGLYGVDIKLLGGKAVVIEVNDNPSIDGGIEDHATGDYIYETIMTSLLRRMENKRPGQKSTLEIESERGEKGDKTEKVSEKAEKASDKTAEKGSKTDKTTPPAPQAASRTKTAAPREKTDTPAQPAPLPPSPPEVASSDPVSAQPPADPKPARKRSVKAAPKAPKNGSTPKSRTKRVTKVETE